MEGGKLFARKGWKAFEPVNPESITYVREYGWNRPFLLVVIDDEKYKARPWWKDYNRIIDFIEEHTEFRLRNKFVHWWNRFWYGRLW